MVGMGNQAGMLSLSKKTDYALLALCYLTQSGADRAVNTKEIAEQYDIPLELLAKILQKLAKYKLVTSNAGPAGGYRLARTPEAISIGAVIEAIDGPPAIVHCMKQEGENACDQLDKCTIRPPLARINARIMEMLSLISLAEISRDENEILNIPFVSRREALTPIRVTVLSERRS